MTKRIDGEMLLAYLANDLDVEDEGGLDAETKLFSTGLIDSFQMMQLLEYVEKVCGFRVPPDDITLEHFDTVARVLGYLEGRIGGGA